MIKPTKHVLKKWQKIRNRCAKDAGLVAARLRKIPAPALSKEPMGSIRARLTITGRARRKRFQAGSLTACLCAKYFLNLGQGHGSADMESHEDLYRISLV